LPGPRVLITRAREGADRAAEAFRAAGAIPVLAPTIETLPTGDPTPFRVALAALQADDWVVLTSPTAARVWVDLVPAAAVRGRIAVIGEATADVLRQAGMPVTLIGPQATGVELATAIVAQGGGRLVLLPRSDRALQGLPEYLRQAGLATMDLALYRTRSRTWTDEEAAEAAAVAAVTLMSPSAVVGLLAQSGVADWLPGARLVAMGPTTAAAVLEQCGRLDAVADPVSLAGLVAATAAALAR
jgi:uroporphyrinogen-III synthase